MKLYTRGHVRPRRPIALEWSKPFEATRLSKEERQTPEYLAINPAGRCLRSTSTAGSSAERRHPQFPADTHPDAKLGGAARRGTRRGKPVLSFSNSDVHRSSRFLAARISSKTRNDRQGKGHARKSLRTLLERATNSSRQRLDRGTRSIADPYLFVVLRWARAVKVDLSGLDHLHAFFERMRKDPGVQKALEEEGLA